MKTSQFDFDQKTEIEDKKFNNDVICRDMSQQKIMIVRTYDKINSMKLILNCLISNIIEINIQFIHINQTQQE